MMNNALELSCKPSSLSSTNKSQVILPISQHAPIYEVKWEGALDDANSTGCTKQVSNMVCLENRSTNRMRYITSDIKAYYAISSFASYLLKEQELLPVELESTFQKRFWDILA